MRRSAWQRARSAAREAAASQRWRFVLRQWPWAAVPFGLFYLIRLAAHFGAVIGATYMDADTAAAPVIGQLLPSAAPHSHILLGNFGWYSTLLFELATRWLPLHRQIWEVAPYGMALAAAGLIGWSVWRLAGAMAASLSVVLLVCASPRMLHLLLSTTEHGPVWFCLALLGFVLVLAAASPNRLPRPLTAFLILLAGLITGVNAASDVLVLIGGIAPLIVATVTAHALFRTRESFRVLVLSGWVLVATGAVWVTTSSVMSHFNVTPCECRSGITHLARASHVSKQFQLLWQSVVDLSNGWFFGAKLTASSLLMVCCAVLGLTAVALLPRIAWSELRLRESQVGVRHPEARAAFIVYWTVSAAFLTLAFLVSADPVDLGADRYLVGVIYAAAAVVPVAVARHRAAQAAALAGTIIFALTATLSIGKRAPDQPTLPSATEADAVARIAAKNHVLIGYAGYWDAAPMTWATHFRIRVYPVRKCGRSLCQFYEHVISSWYIPRPSTRSFLLQDPTLPARVSPSPAFGDPSAVYRVGEMTMYLYPYDLASKIGPIAPP
jgi:hypothetical protein